MDKILLYPIGTSRSCHYAQRFLHSAGCPLIDHPAPEITHLLLDVPSFRKDGLMHSGTDINTLLPMLPKTITIIGGNLRHPGLELYNKIDLLQNPAYLAENAAITAECALQAAAPHMNITFREASVTILGWGRIGKCLAKLLKGFGAKVTVVARKEHDRAMLTALGYQALDFPQVSSTLENCDLLFNTISNAPLSEGEISSFKNGIAIDLASEPGLHGKSVVPARGLPGKYAPESSGKLIAETILKSFKEGIQ